MRTLFAWLGVATLMILSPAQAQAGTPTALKPYIVMILDTSGSMTGATGSGPPSCPDGNGNIQADTKLNHARCAINNIVNSYGGDIVFAFGKFRETPTGTFATDCNTDCNTNALAVCGACNTTTDAGCTTAMASDNLFQMLTSLSTNNASQSAAYTNSTCNTCAEPFGPNIGATDPEILFANSSTPLNGAFRGGKRYWLGQEFASDGSTTIWPSTLEGYNPIAADPMNNQFLPVGCDPSPTCTSNCCATQCRPYITIMLTDGDETCSMINNAWPSVGNVTTTNTIAASPGGATDTVAIAASPGGATESFAIQATNGATEAGTTATFRTTANHGLAVGDSVIVSGVGAAGYNGTWTVTTIVSTTRFTATLPTTGLGNSGGGTVSTPNATITTTVASGIAAGDSVVVAGVGVAGYNGTWTVVSTPSGTTFTVRIGAPGLASSGGGTVTTKIATITTTAAHGLSIGDNVIVSGVGVAGYNGTWIVTGIPTTTTFTFQLATGGLAASGGGTVRFAPGLLATDVMTGSPPTLKRYHVVTKAIGFGVPTVPYAQIENIAHAGGATDIIGANEGYYANDQAGLELAISQIIEGSIRSESCNGLDDDCDGKIDEDFKPPLGNTCDNGLLGKCKGTGTFICSADGTGVTCNITSPGGTPQTTCPVGKTCNPDNTETCNDGIDDDCDGFIDEGCTACIPTAEICDGKDNDCDGNIDEDVPPRQCGAGSCFPNAGCCGTQVCINGSYGACSATVPTPPPAESCNNIDDDCDGAVDEDLTKSCSSITGNGCTVAPCPGTNNPGDTATYRCSGDVGLHRICTGPTDMTCPAGSQCVLPIPQNVCHPGQEVCTAGVYGSCNGEQTPTAEVCNGIDDDCDNKIDENTGGGACSTSCGIGTIVCATPPNCGGTGQPACGTLYCNAQPATGDHTCDGVDDDCDGKIDEDWQCGGVNGSLPNVPCSCGTGTTCEQNQCINGQVTCVDTQPITPEQCNCKDDDCDGNVDEGQLCGTGGAACIDCQCAFPCSGGEFPCPGGKKCDAGYCVDDPCFGVSCPAMNGKTQTCVENTTTHMGQCVDACSVPGVCTTGLRCYDADGQCYPDDCTSPFPDRKCMANQNCVVDSNTGMGTCVSNPCSGVTCPSDQYCEAGQCIASCATITCPTGQRCQLGMCQTDPCGKQCPAGQVCNDANGTCIDDPCQFRHCPTGQWCNPNDGMCETDPCVGTMCPADPPGQVCKGGTCETPAQAGTDAGVGNHVTVAGGGCSTGGSSGAGVLVGLALFFVRRRRGGRAS